MKKKEFLLNIENLQEKNTKFLLDIENLQQNNDVFIKEKQSELHGTKEIHH